MNPILAMAWGLIALTAAFSLLVLGLLIVELVNIAWRSLRSRGEESGVPEDSDEEPFWRCNCEDCIEERAIQTELARRWVLVAEELSDLGEQTSRLEELYVIEVEQ